MSTKTKNTKTPIEQLSQISQQAGLLLMTAAVTVGMIEMPEHPNSKVVVPNQPAFATAQTPGAFGGFDNGNNALRREREETGPHYVSYSNEQRTPGRTGKV